MIYIPNIIVIQWKELKVVTQNPKTYEVNTLTSSKKSQHLSQLYSTQGEPTTSLYYIDTHNSTQNLPSFVWEI